MTNLSNQFQELIDQGLLNPIPAEVGTQMYNAPQPARTRIVYNLGDAVIRAGVDGDAELEPGSRGNPDAISQVK